MASPEQWEVNSGQYRQVFVFALFCSGNPAAVGYKSGSEEWGVKGVEFRVRGSVGNRLRVGVSIRNRFRYKYCSLHTTSGQLFTSHCSENPSNIESSQFYFVIPPKVTLNYVNPLSTGAWSPWRPSPWTTLIRGVDWTS